MTSNQHLERVRRICFALGNVVEKLSHGEPTFFVKKKVFVMFAGNHHNDGRTAVWIPTHEGLQTTLIENSPHVFFKPPYVGLRGWVGIELSHISDIELEAHIQDAWHLIASPKSSTTTK
jgi:hypothetical protein